MFASIYIIFVVCALSFSIYRNILMYRKGKIVPSSFKMRENPLLFSLDSLTIILFILGAYFFVTSDELPILIIIYYIFLTVVSIQIITLNFLTYKKAKDKEIIIHTLIHLLVLIIPAIFLFKIAKVIIKLWRIIQILRHNCSKVWTNLS